MKRLALALGLCTLAACNSPAPGEDDGEAINWAPEGTRILLSNLVDGARSNTTITVGRAEGTRGSYSGPDGVAQSFYPGCWACGGSVTIERDKYDTLWPLIPGNSVTFLRTAADGTTAEVVITIVGTERITLPDGDGIEAVVLDTRVRSLTGAAWTAEMKSWWAPQLGWVIKARGESSLGTTLESVLVDWRPPQ